MLTKIAVGKMVAGLSNERRERLLGELKLRRLAAEFFERSYNRELYSYVVRKLAVP